eukprot:Selendium_serpulae@DN9344_c0_g1_i1.p2
MMYFGDARDVKAKEELDLRQCDVKWTGGDVNKDRTHSFTIHSAASKRTICFSAESEEETKQWLAWCKMAASGGDTTLAFTDEELRIYHPTHAAPKSPKTQTRHHKQSRVPKSADMVVMAEAGIHMSTMPMTAPDVRRLVVASKS